MRGAYTRLPVVVGTMVSYSLMLHVKMLLHPWLLVGVAVGACDSYCIDVQVVSAVHSRCEVDVRLVVSY